MARRFDAPISQALGPAFDSVTTSGRDVTVTVFLPACLSTILWGSSQPQLQEPKVPPHRAVGRRMWGWLGGRSVFCVFIPVSRPPGCKDTAAPSRPIIGEERAGHQQTLLIQREFLYQEIKYHFDSILRFLFAPCTRAHWLNNTRQTRLAVERPMHACHACPIS